MARNLQKRTSRKTQAQRDAALENALAYIHESRAAATSRAYRTDWRIFCDWCDRLRFEPLPASPHCVAMFLASQASTGLSPSTLVRRLSAIRLVHCSAQELSPHSSLEVTDVMRGLRRDWGNPKSKKSAAEDDDIKKMCDGVTEGTLKGLRDRALLLLGFAGAFRRSELVALNVAHLKKCQQGLLVTVSPGYFVQVTQGNQVAILAQPGSRYCPVLALDDWLTVAEIESGPLFFRFYKGDSLGPRGRPKKRLSAQSVALIVKEYARRAGLDPIQYAGHSLRRGFVTSAVKTGAKLHKVQAQTRHRSTQMVKKYFEAEDGS